MLHHRESILITVVQEYSNMKNQNAVSLGSLGGKARAKNLSKERMSEIGKLGAQKKKEKKLAK